VPGSILLARVLIYAPCSFPRLQSAADPHSSLPPEAQPSRIMSSPKAGTGGLDASLGQIAAPAGTQPTQPAAVHGAVAAEQIQMAILPSQPTQPAAEAAAAAAAAAAQAAAAAAAAAAAPAPAADAGAGAAAADAEKHQEMITGVLEKRGELGTPGQLRWVERYVVLCEGELTYYKTQADYELGKQPRKNNRVRLSQYCVCAGEPAETLLIDKSREGRNAGNDVDWARGFFLRPLPFAGMPQRTWEFRAVEVQDLKDWLDVFTEQGCLSEAGYAALVAAPHRAAELLGADHPAITSGAAYVPPPTPEAMVSRAVAAHGAAAAASAAGAASPDAAARSVSPGGSDSSSAASPGAPAAALAAAGVPINTAEPSDAAPAPAAGAPIVATAAAAAAAAGAVLPPDLPPAAFSDPAAVLAAHTAPVPVAPTRPYNAAALVLTPAVIADLSDPATDAEDPRFFAGYIEKRGEQAFAGYKKRWVALKRGFMMYYADQAARKRVRCVWAAVAVCGRVGVWGIESVAGACACGWVLLAGASVWVVVRVRATACSVCQNRAPGAAAAFGFSCGAAATSPVWVKPPPPDCPSHGSFPLLSLRPPFLAGRQAQPRQPHPPLCLPPRAARPHPEHQAGAPCQGALHTAPPPADCCLP